MNNIKVRQAIKEAGVKYWQVADAMGISDVTFSRWLRYELPAAEQADIIKAVAKIKGGVQHE